MTWDELRTALDTETGNHDEVYVLVGDQYIPIELVTNTKSKFFFVPTMAEDEDNGVG